MLFLVIFSLPRDKAVRLCEAHIFTVCCIIKHRQYNLYLLITSEKNDGFL